MPQTRAKRPDPKRPSSVISRPTKQGEVAHPGANRCANPHTPVQGATFLRQAVAKVATGHEDQVQGNQNTPSPAGHTQGQHDQ